MSKPILNDTVRQAANFILAPAMWVFSTLPQVTDWGRTASEFSNQNDSLLVPFGVAFSIWFPIFILCTIYAVFQALPSQKKNPVFRAAGPWTALGFLSVTGWALLSAHAPDSFVLWVTALVFIPTVYGLVKAMNIMQGGAHVDTSLAHKLSRAGIGMIAGWTSLALFLNWTPLIGTLTDAPEVPLCIVMLIVALTLIILNLKKSGGRLAYVFPTIWGLSFLAYERYQTGVAFETLGSLAILGGLGMGLYTVFLRRNARSF